MGRRATGSIRKRGGVWWLRYNAHGRRVEETSGTGDERAARSMLAQRKRELAEGTWKPAGDRAAAANVARLEAELATARSASLGAATVRAYLEQRLAQRSKAGLRSARIEAQYARDFVNPAIGMMLLGAVTRAHVRDLVTELRSKPSAKTGKPLAARTVLHVYRFLATAFADAVLEKRVAENPCTLRARRGELPIKGDRDPEFRTSSVYSAADASALIFDERVPADRRTVYALELLAGLRSAEACGARWSDLDASATPLGRLLVARQADGAKGERATKTGDVRAVPVHPLLAQVLERWRVEGFPLLFMRAPRPTDPIVPSRADVSGCSFRVPGTVHNRLVEDLERLEIRRPPWAQHAMRATFLSLLESAGANIAIARRATHRGPSDVVGGYIRIGWADLCREIGKLTIEQPPPDPKRDNSRGKISAHLAGALETGSRSMGPAGVEVAPVVRIGRKTGRASADRTGTCPRGSPAFREGSAGRPAFRGAVSQNAPEALDVALATLEEAARVLRALGEPRRAAGLEELVTNRRARSRRARDAG